MKKKSNTIVFFGSGPVAAKSLELLSREFVIEAIITKPATKHEMSTAAPHAPVYTVGTKTELNELLASTPFHSHVGVLIDFGIIVSQEVIDSFPKGIVNSHFSLLPQWRGADPITFSILSGQARTGVSLMLLVAAMDEGPVLACGIYELSGKERSADLTDGLVHLSDALLKHNLPEYLAGRKTGLPQSELATHIPEYPTTPTYSRKLTKEDGVLDFDKPAKILEREIRAFSQWPRSRTTVAGKDCIVVDASVDATLNGKPGSVFRTSNQIGIYTARGALLISTLQPAGKKPMPAEAFISGYGHNLPRLSLLQN